MMLTKNNQSKREYTTDERDREERIKTCIREMNVQNIQIDNEYVVQFMEELTENWMNEKNNMHWNTIIDGIKMLPGTKEEKLIFLLGYMSHAFLNELQEKEKNDNRIR